MTNTDFNKFDVITHVIPKEWIENSFFEEIDNVFRMWLADPIKFENKIIILISGYDNDPRPIWEIQEIRDYFKTLDLLFPYWFYFLRKDKEMEKQFGLKFIMLLLIPTKTININPEVTTVEFDIPLSIEFIEQHFISLNELTDRMGLPIEENIRISKEVTECLM